MGTVVNDLPNPMDNVDGFGDPVVNLGAVDGSWSDTVLVTCEVCGAVVLGRRSSFDAAAPISSEAMDTHRAWHKITPRSGE